MTSWKCHWCDCCWHRWLLYLALLSTGLLIEIQRASSHSSTDSLPETTRITQQQREVASRRDPAWTNARSLESVEPAVTESFAAVESSLTENHTALERSLVGSYSASHDGIAMPAPADLDDGANENLPDQPSNFADNITFLEPSFFESLASDSSIQPTLPEVHGATLPSESAILLTDESPNASTFSQLRSIIPSATYPAIPSEAIPVVGSDFSSSPTLNSSMLSNGDLQTMTPRSSSVHETTLVVATPGPLRSYNLTTSVEASTKTLPPTSSQAFLVASSDSDDVTRATSSVIPGAYVNSTEFGINCTLGTDLPDSDSEGFEWSTLVIVCVALGSALLVLLLCAIVLLGVHCHRRRKLKQKMTPRSSPSHGPYTGLFDDTVTLSYINNIYGHLDIGKDTAEQADEMRSLDSDAYLRSLESTVISNPWVDSGASARF